MIFAMVALAILVIFLGIVCVFVVLGILGLWIGDALIGDSYDITDIFTDFRE